MNGNRRAVLDANVLIYLSKGTLRFQELATRGYTELYIPVVAYMEVVGYRDLPDAEAAILRQLLHQLPIVQTDMELAEYVIGYRRQRRIKLPDAMILATARQLGADLVTKNTADFRGLDPAVRLVEPF